MAGGTGAQAASVATASAAIHATPFIRLPAHIDEYLDIAPSASSESGMHVPLRPTRCQAGDLLFFNTKLIFA